MKLSRSDFRNYLPWLLFFSFVIFTTTRDAVLLFRHPFAVGVNGYYYVLQVNQLAETGHLYFPTRTPLALYTLMAVARIVGNSITTIKALGILLQILLSIGIFGVVRNATSNSWVALLGLGLTIIPQSRLYLTTEYINQLFGLVLLIWAGLTFMRAFRTRGLVRWLIPFGLVVGAYVSHKSAQVFVPTIVICLLLMFALTGSAVWKSLGFAALTILWFSPAIVSAQPFVGIPEWLQNQITYRPHWPIDPAVIPEELMLVTAAVGVLFLVLWQSKKGKGPDLFILAFGGLSLFSLLVTLNPFFNVQTIMSAVAGRSRLLSYVQVACLVPALIWLVYSRKREAAIYVGAAFLPLVVLSALAPLPLGLRPEFLVRREQLIESLRNHAKELAQDSIIIAPHGDQFVVTAITGIPAQQQPPTSSRYSNEYWLLNTVSDQSFGTEGIVLNRSHDSTIMLLDDEILQRKLLELGRSETLLLLSANPHLAGTLPQGGLKRK